MNDDLGALYQEMILDHGKNPRNRGEPEGANHHLEGFNPLCGDRFTLHLVVDEGGVVKDVGFEGSGCAISTASASTMTQAVKGKTREEIEAIFSGFHDLVTGQRAAEDAKGLGKLKVFAGVAAFPMRVKCATLAWHTLKGALEGKSDAVSTED